MRLLSFVVIVTSCAASTTAVSGIVGFKFSGTVINAFQDPFDAGITHHLPTLVSGRVTYDTNSLATDPIDGCDCMGYRQHIPGGFSATFGDTLVLADHYVVQIKNDRPQPGGVVTDTVSVRYSSDFEPFLVSPLRVNGIEYPDSWFQVNLDASGETFANASLPQSLDLHRFNSIYNFLDEVTTDEPIGVLFSNDLLSPIEVNLADYDGSGDVEQNDYDLWRRTFASTFDLDADGNGDLVVDAADYVMWRKFALSSAVESAVPEPSSLLLAALSMCASGRRRPTWRVQCPRRK